MGTGRSYLPSKCRVVDVKNNHPQNSQEGPPSETIQITGSQKLTARRKGLHLKPYKLQAVRN
jgi:hypothetical protein